MGIPWSKEQLLAANEKLLQKNAVLTREAKKYTETLNQTRRRRDDLANRLSAALRTIKELKLENRKLREGQRGRVRYGKARIK